MRRIKSNDTQPELLVRRFLHAEGFRYRLHSASLPGKPDLVFPSKHKVVFVHGCFWHLHGACREGRIPNSRREYWEPKLLRNKKRDQEHELALTNLEWKYMILWECELKEPSEAFSRLIRFLKD
jgi:DNA mismatch endonuclease, patch repair protein